MNSSRTIDYEIGYPYLFPRAFSSNKNTTLPWRMCSSSLISFSARWSSHFKLGLCPTSVSLILSKILNIYQRHPLLREDGRAISRVSCPAYLRAVYSSVRYGCHERGHSRKHLIQVGQLPVKPLEVWIVYLFEHSDYCSSLQTFGIIGIHITASLWWCWNRAMIV